MWKGWHEHGSIPASLIPLHRLVYQTRLQYLRPSHTILPYRTPSLPRLLFTRLRPDTPAGHHSQIFTERPEREEEDGKAAVKRRLLCAGVSCPRASEHCNSSQCLWTIPNRLVICVQGRNSFLGSAGGAAVIHAGFGPIDRVKDPLGMDRYCRRGSCRSAAV